MVHSDRGTQYASSLYQALMSQRGLTAPRAKMTGNISRKGNCWGNGVIDRFFESEEGAILAKRPR